jgi:hypothetical protein
LAAQTGDGPRQNAAERIVQADRYPVSKALLRRYTPYIREEVGLFKKIAMGVTVTALTLVLSLAGAGQADARGGHGGGGGANSSVALVLLESIDGSAHSGQRVTFSVATTATSPFVSLNCYQGGVWVSAASAGFFAAYPWSQDFTLASTTWTGGDADCTALLYTSRDGTKITSLATLSFHVYP